MGREEGSKEQAICVMCHDNIMVLHGNCQLCERPSWPNGPTHFEPLRSYTILTPKVLYP